MRSTPTNKHSESDAPENETDKPVLVRPAQVETEADRIAMFEYIIETYAKGPLGVERAVGVSRGHIYQIINGRKSLSGVGLELAQKILKAVNLPPNEMRDMLNLPEEYRDRWTTLVPAIDERKKGVRELPLDRPVTGEWSGPRAYALMIDTHNFDSGLVVCVFPTSFFVAPFDEVPAGAKVLGQLLDIDVSYRREVIPQAFEDWLI